ncbi:MAG: glycosyltransferase [Prevotella sp.]|nr:glycosyltransferase [Prevotella sp.]
MQTQQNHTQGDGQVLISFIIPAYNVPTDMLRQCLDSIRALSLRRYEREIIVVDDGSDLPFISALTEYQNDIIYIRKANGGLSTARNMGIRMATGAYIQFIDGDDMLIQAPYEHVTDLIRYGKSDLVMFHLTDTLQKKMDYNDCEPMSGAELMRSRNIHGTACGILFKRTIMGSLRFTPGIYHEDEEFTPQLLLRAERVITTDAKAYFYRHRPDTITTSNDIRKRLKRLNDAKGVILRLNTLAATLPAEERLAMQRRTAQLTMDYIYNVITQTKSQHYLDRRLEELRRKGLFPLPDRDYTTKYKWFRRMTNTSAGLKMLLHTLPYINRER